MDLPKKEQILGVKNMTLPKNGEFWGEIKNKIWQKEQILGVKS